MSRRALHGTRHPSQDGKKIGVRFRIKNKDILIEAICPSLDGLVVDQTPRTNIGQRFQRQSVTFSFGFRFRSHGQL